MVSRGVEIQAVMCPASRRWAIKFDPEDRADYCEKTWGVKPDRDWLRIKYWTDDLGATSNTIWSNGDIDPWGPGGQLAQIRPDLPTPLVKGKDFGAFSYLVNKIICFEDL